MIVVAGGSGLLGRQVVADLVGRGEQVRVLVRDPARARAQLGEAVEVVAADLRQADGLDTAVAGASMVISAVHGFGGGRGAGPVEVDERGNANLVTAATSAGAAVVLVSVLGASPDSPVEIFRAKYNAEQHLRNSVAPWTIVRAGAFLETWLSILTKTAGTSGRPLIFGRGEQPIAFVAVADVAAVVSRAATDANTRGQILDVAGEPFTMNELARALQAARGWQGAPRHLPRPLLRTLSILSRPVSPAFARQSHTALAMDTTTLAANTPSSSPFALPLHTVPDVLRRFHPS